jgi:hypothetical protein
LLPVPWDPLPPLPPLLGRMLGPPLRPFGIAAKTASALAVFNNALRKVSPSFPDE